MEELRGNPGANLTALALSLKKRGEAAFSLQMSAVLEWEVGKVGVRSGEQARPPRDRT